MKPDHRYYPKTTEQKLGYLVEECGEVMAAVGKTQRWGLDSTNPEIPPSERETNRAWILRELVDLKQAIELVEVALGVGVLTTEVRRPGWEPQYATEPGPPNLGTAEAQAALDRAFSDVPGGDDEGA